MNRYPSFPIIITSALLMICGVSLVGLLNIQLSPSAHSSSFSISFAWPNTVAQVVEQEVTSKLEALCAGVQGVKDIYSKSDNGKGAIDIDIDKKADADAIRFEVSMLIRQVWSKLPVGVSYPLISVNRPDDSKKTPMLSYTLNAPSAPYLIQKYAENIVKPALSQIPGIYRIEVYGASPMERQIVYDANRVKALNIEPSDIQNAVNLRLRKENLGKGYLQKNPSSNVEAVNGNKAFISSSSNDIRSNGEEFSLVIASSGDAQNLDNLLVKQSNGRTIYLHDIAMLCHQEASAQSYFRINGLNTINIYIYAAAQENNLTLSRLIKDKLKQLEVSFPAGYSMIMGYDSTEYINNELNNIGIRTFFTLTILLLFVLLVTRKLKHVLLIMVMLLANLSIAVLFYYLLKIEIHLYALAGITVSLGLMTDNIIIMSDHLRTRGNRLVWLGIFAGTLCTISALTIIFFLDERIKVNLIDFALVIIINQAVSLLTALFLIPALMDVLKLGKEHNRLKNRKKNGSLSTAIKSFTSQIPLINRSLGHRGGSVVIFTNIYQRFYLLLRKRRFVPITVFVLGFGLPVFMLPDKWEGERWFNKVYNSTIGSNGYKESVRPWINKALGGTLHLFSERVFEGSYFKTPEETSLYITANMPNGTTVQQMNALAALMEKYLLQFKEIRLFQTNVYDRSASIVVYFKKEFHKSEFPYVLKEQVVSKALELGGAGWSVYGFGDAFSNNLYEGAGQYRIGMLGYNHDELYSLSEKLKENLQVNPRVKEVYIVPEITWRKPDNTEFTVKLDAARAIASGISPFSIYESLSNLTFSNISFTTSYFSGSAEDIKLKPLQSAQTDVWTLERIPLAHDSIPYKFKNLCQITKEVTSPSVCKENQQYRLYLQFNYIGTDKIARMHIDKTIKEFKPYIPLGYSVQLDDYSWYWEQQSKRQYWLLGLIIIMIFFICAVLFESLLQPFAVILTIPVAYIGVFLTFYLFDLNFDQGGFAAFVLLSGITVNAAIYILNDYNSLKRHYHGRNLSSVKMYFKAFNYKIIPILLTIVATVLGFIPFLIGEKQAFWFSLAAGTIGGLIFSLIGIFIYLPLFLGVKK